MLKCEYVGVKPGTTTEEIDAVVHEFIIKSGAYPLPLGFLGCPKSVVTAVNEVCGHGIPDSRPLLDGDIVNIDISIYMNGLFGDNAAMYLIGNVDPEARLLCQRAKEAVYKGIEACHEGAPFNVIGEAIRYALSS